VLVHDLRLNDLCVVQSATSGTYGNMNGPKDRESVKVRVLRDGVEDRLKLGFVLVFLHIQFKSP
jgi:hypothetical protein